MSVLIDAGLLQQYPVNVSVLKKGDVIDTATLETITGKKPDNPNWNFALLSVRAFIEKQSKNEGMRLIPRIDHGTIRIQTDEEAAKYTHHHAGLGRRRFYRNHRRQMDVDMRNLSEQGRREHERSIIMNGRMIASMNAVRSLPEVKPHERSVPLLEDKKS